MPHLAQSLLGSYQISLDKRPLSGFRAGKVRALLVYLSVESKVPHPRERLMALLWPEQSERRARQNLRQTLSRLHQALGYSAKHSPFTSVSAESVQFKSQSDTYLDVQQFLYLSSELPDHSTTYPLSIDEQKRLETAISLYRGEFMAGFSLPNNAAFEEWLVLYRNQMLQRAVGILDHLVAHFMAAQLWEKAKTYVEQQLALDPWQEKAHNQLIRLLAWTGRRSAALAQYEQCRHLLVNDLGVTLAVETEQLYEQLIANQLHAPEAKPSPAIEKTSWHDGLFTAVNRFIGREAEFQQLVDMVNQPQCRLITITGPSGIGKSALLWKLGLFLSKQKSKTVQLIDLTQENKSQSLRTISLVHSGLLLLDGMDLFLEDATRIVTLFRKNPALQIVVTCQSQLHMSGEWVIRLNRLSFPQMDEAFDETSHEAIRYFLQTVQRITPSTTIQSRSLTAVADICRHLEGHPLGLEIVAGWVRMLSCEEIAQRLAQGNDLLQTHHTDFPSRHRCLSQFYQHAWHELAAENQQALLALSVFGANFSANDALAVAQIGLDQLMQLWDRSWLEQAENGRFRLSPLVRRFVGQTSHVDVTQAQVTFTNHFASLLANCLPMLRGNGQQKAVQQIEQESGHITQMWANLPALSDRQRIEQALYALFLYYDMTGQYQTGEKQFNQALQQEPRWQPAHFGFLLVARGWFAYQLRRHGEAMHLMQAGINFLSTEAKGPAWLIVARAYFSAVLQTVGEFDEANRQIEISLTLAQEKGDWSGSSLALNIAGKLAFRSGDYDKARRLCQQSLSLKHIVKDEWGSAYCHKNLGDIATATECWFEAEQHYQFAQQIWQKLNNQIRCAMLLTNMAHMALLQKEVQMAQQHYRQAQIIYDVKGDMLGVANMLTQLGKLARRAHRYEQAQHYYHEGLKTAVSHHLTPKIIEILTEFGQLQLEQTQITHRFDRLWNDKMEDMAGQKATALLTLLTQSIQQMPHPPVLSELAATATSILQRQPF